jgi:hypothetical protein
MVAQRFVMAAVSLPSVDLQRLDQTPGPIIVKGFILLDTGNAQLSELV